MNVVTNASARKYLRSCSHSSRAPYPSKGTPMPSLNGAVVLVTGANGGLGTHFVHDALARGAAKVYATARSPRAWDDERIVPLTLDITDPASIDAAVAAAPDVTMLINNAGAVPPSASLFDVSEA